MRSTARRVRPAATCSALTAALVLSGTAAGAQGSTTAHDDWIGVSALSWGTGTTAAAKGGNVEYEWTVEEGESPPPQGRAKSLSSDKAGAATAAGTPKLAQFAINGNALGACRIGTRYPRLRLNDGRKRWQLSNVDVVGCDGTRMTVSYESRAARR